MRILSVHNAHYFAGGDAASFIRTNRLLEERGHQVIPFSVLREQNIPTAYDQYFAVDFDTLDPLRASLKRLEGAFFSPEARRKIDRLLDAHPVDIAHLHSVYGWISYSILGVLERRGIPVVQTMHDYKLICPVHSLQSRNGEVCERCRGARYYQCVLRNCSPYSHPLLKSIVHCLEMYFNHFVLHHPDRIARFIAPSEFMERKVVEFGIAADKVTVIPNFLDVEAYTPGFDHEEYYVYVGRLSAEKNLEGLIKAAQTIPDAHLLLIGDGPEMSHLRRLAAEIKATNVHFTGYKSGPQLHDLMRKAICLVLPSTCYENAPFVILEAFALGTPVIGSRLGGIPELIAESQDGLLCEPNDVDDLREKIARLLANRHNGSLEDMGRCGREKVEKRYNAKLYYERLTTLYREVLASRKEEQCLQKS